MWAITSLFSNFLWIFVQSNTLDQKNLRLLKRRICVFGKVYIACCIRLDPPVDLTKTLLEALTALSVLNLLTSVILYSRTCGLSALPPNMTLECVYDGSEHRPNRSLHQLQSP